MKKNISTMCKGLIIINIESIMDRDLILGKGRHLSILKKSYRPIIAIMSSEMSIKIVIVDVIAFM